MAIDQALAERYLLEARFYRWSPACLSLGIAQRLERDVDQAACAALGIDVVRRQTGGRAILHDQEVTYSLVTAADDPLVCGFEQGWQIALEPDELSPTEEARAAQLVGERYANPAWTALR